MVAEKASEDPRKVTLSDDVAKRLDDVAKAAGKTRDELVNELLAAELDERERFIAAVEEGIAEADRGELLDGEAVDAKHRGKVAKIRAEHGR